jgi:hypothetical protein
MLVRVKGLLVQEGYVDLFKGKGHKQFKGSYLQLWDRIIQQCYEQEILLDDPILDKVCHLATGLRRGGGGGPPPPGPGHTHVHVPQSRKGDCGCSKADGRHCFSCQRASVFAAQLLHRSIKATLRVNTRQERPVSLHRSLPHIHHPIKKSAQSLLPTKVWCSSDIRNFRYVGTLTACHVASCLVKVMVNLAEERGTAQSQEAAEARKKGNKVSTHSRGHIPTHCSYLTPQYSMMESPGGPFIEFPSHSIICIPGHKN